MDAEPAGHAEMSQDRLRAIGVDEQVLADPAQPGDLRADELAQRPARWLACHVEAFASHRHRRDSLADELLQRLTNGLDLG